MEFKGTPGPWEHDGEYVWHEPTQAGENVTPICQCDLYSDDARDANARLIAAAPELLEAVQVLLMACTYREGGEAHRRAEAAIAKALGDV